MTTGKTGVFNSFYIKRENSEGIEVMKRPWELPVGLSSLEREDTENK